MDIGIEYGVGQRSAKFSGYFVRANGENLARLGLASRVEFARRRSGEAKSARKSRMHWENERSNVERAQRVRLAAPRRSRARPKSKRHKPSQKNKIEMNDSLGNKVYSIEKQYEIDNFDYKKDNKGNVFLIWGSETSNFNIEMEEK